MRTIQSVKVLVVVLASQAFDILVHVPLGVLCVKVRAISAHLRRCGMSFLDHQCTITTSQHQLITRVLALYLPCSAAPDSLFPSFSISRGNNTPCSKQDLAFLYLAPPGWRSRRKPGRPAPRCYKFLRGGARHNEPH